MIEKLGITPGWFPGFNWICNDKGKGKNGVLFECDEDCTVEDFRVAIAAPEMLEALIRSTIKLEANRNNLPNTIWKLWSDYFIPTIEKATCRTWVEVKELIKEE